jgi:DNA-binding transcriptional MocR family regulator
VASLNATRDIAGNLAVQANSAPLAVRAMSSLGVAGTQSVGASHLVRLLEGWAGGRGALHRQLSEALRVLVRIGQLPTGTRLPSERTLAVMLHLSRTTVSAAFDQLREEGVFTSVRGDGTYVSAAGLHTVIRGDDRLGTFAGSMAEPPGGFIDLGSAALPGLDLVADLLRHADLSDLAGLVATHGYLPAGLPRLRELVARYHTALGLPTNPDQILVTSGAQQGLRLVATLLLERGAYVAIEEPSFRGAIEVLRSGGARLLPIPSTPEGLDLDVLRDIVAHRRPDLVLVQSTVHNPVGSVLDAPRSAALASLAEKTGIPVVDDAALAETLVDGPPRLPLASFGGPVITLGSMSKIFWGGLRIGWVRADAALIRSLTLLKSGKDLGTSLPGQLLAAQLLPLIDQARTERQESLRQRRAIVLDEMARLLPDWTPYPPAGGASLWVRLPGGVSATVFTQMAERAGVLVLPGPTFSCVDGLDDHLRIAFAEPMPTVQAGLVRLAAVWRSLVG